MKTYQSAVLLRVLNVKRASSQEFRGCHDGRVGGLPFALYLKPLTLQILMFRRGFETRLRTGGRFIIIGRR